MIPSIEEPYTYLKIIFQDESPEIRKIGQEAYRLLARKTVNLSSKENLQNNISFLKNIATKQQANEKAFLEAKASQLEKLGNGEIQQKLKEILTGKFDYVKFTKILNEALTSINSFTSRLQAIKRADDGLGEQEKLLNELENNLFADLSEEKKNLSYGKPELIKQLTLKFLQKYGQDFIMNSDNPLDIAAAAVIIQQALARYLYDNKKFETQEKNFLGKKENFIELYNSLVNELEDFSKDTDITKIFSNQTFLTEAKNLLGLNLDPSLKPSPKKRNKVYAIDELKKELQNDPFFNLPELKETFSQIRVNWKGKNKNSTLEEIMMLIREKGLQLGQLNSATDTLGVFEILFPEADKSQNSERSLKALKKLRAELIAQKAANDPRKTSEIYQNELKKLDKELDGIGKSFIIHDTVKLYKSLENYKQSDFSSFTGRQMSIFNYISSLAEMGHDFGANTKWLEFAAYNVSKSALGSFNKAPLETIFSIAAGLIMFDDFSLVARDLADNIQFSNITNIHLYQVQGIYVPSSYILTETYNNMTYFLDHQGPPKNNGISATISAPSFNFVDKNNSTQIDWENIKKKARDTKVKLHFMTNFLNFVGQILG